MWHRGAHSGLSVKEDTRLTTGRSLTVHTGSTTQDPSAWAQADLLKQFLVDEEQLLRVVRALSIAHIRYLQREGTGPAPRRRATTTWSSRRSPSRTAPASSSWKAPRPSARGASLWWTGWWRGTGSPRRYASREEALPTGLRTTDWRRRAGRRMKDKPSPPADWTTDYTAEAFFAERRRRGDKETAIRSLTRCGGEPPNPGNHLPDPRRGGRKWIGTLPGDPTAAWSRRTVRGSAGWRLAQQSAGVARVDDLLHHRWSPRCGRVSGTGSAAPRSPQSRRRGRSRRRSWPR